MSHAELVTMSDRDLRHYIRLHPEDQAAFHLYMDRRHARSGDRSVIEPGDPQWREKFMAMIKQQMA